MERVECVVVGAGVIGLAIARELAIHGKEVIVLEALDAIGTETSSRNSEVIHAGIYYPKGSLKAQLCVSGKDALYNFCSQHGVPHKRLGKLIVAVSHEELGALEKVKVAAHGNGVTDVDFIHLDAVREMEPEIKCVGALFSPSTGIVDSHGLMLALQGDTENHGGIIAFMCHVKGGSKTENGFVLKIGTGEQCADGNTTNLACDILINSAGMGAQRIARGLTGVPTNTIPQLHLARGCYFTMSGKAPFRHLIYPMPDEASLGIHVTIDIAGQVRFGPDVEWIEEKTYDVDPMRQAAFSTAVQRYYPAVLERTLIPGYAGIRPKIQGPGETPKDFMIQGPSAHGISGLVNLFGMESPGLTASLAIASYVRNLLDA